jgi:hypothetical protein
MPLFLLFFSLPKTCRRPPKVNTKPHTETHPYKYLGSPLARHTAGGWVGVCELVGVVGGGFGAARSGDLALPAIDTGERVRNGQRPAVFEDRSRFAGSSGGSSPMVCGLLSTAGRCCGLLTVGGYGKGHRLGVAGGLWCAVCAGGYFMRWGIMRLSSWPCSVVVV